MSVVLSSENLRVKILSKGAEVCSVKNKKGLEFIWQADENVWPRHAPVLFPIVGKLKENTFFYGTTPYSLGQHGFARDRDFILTKSDDASCTFELHSDSGTKSDFPFDFNFQISYRIDDKKLITKYDISNPADLPLYFSV
ncbi:MAG: aldose 1-epimerase family protein, partial [Bacteroidia bacterium]|nr:aldose 1-epimerase family protein [Bacteroidia bacterium]